MYRHDRKTDLLEDNKRPRTYRHQQIMRRIRIFAVDFYYPSEVRRGEYWGLDVFLLQFFTLVNIRKILHYYCMDMNI